MDGREPFINRSGTEFFKLIKALMFAKRLAVVPLDVLG